MHFILSYEMYSSLPVPPQAQGLPLSCTACLEYVCSGALFIPKHCHHSELWERYNPAFTFYSFLSLVNLRRLPSFLMQADKILTLVRPRRVLQQATLTRMINYVYSTVGLPRPYFRWVAKLLNFVRSLAKSRITINPGTRTTKKTKKGRKNNNQNNKEENSINLIAGLSLSEPKLTPKDHQLYFFLRHLLTNPL